MSDDKSSPRRKADKDALADLLQSQPTPLRPPPQLLERSRLPLDDVDLHRRTTRPLTTPRRPLPEPLKREFAEPAPSVTPLVEKSIDLHRARTMLAHETYRHASRQPLFSNLVLGQPWQLALIALISIAIILFTQSRESNILSNFLNRSVSNTQQAIPSLPIAPPGEHSLLLNGPPKITASLIDTVLAKYGSPAAGTGSIWIEMGQRYNIDPAYALAFFIHESSAGTNTGWAGLKPDGSTTHNIGNIICAGYATCFHGFRDYPSWSAGIEDWYKLITQEYVQGRGFFTLEQILPVYCPVADGCVTSDYVKIVNTMVDEWTQHK